MFWLRVVYLLNNLKRFLFVGLTWVSQNRNGSFSVAGSVCSMHLCAHHSMAKKQHTILNSAKLTLQLEGTALLHQAESIDARFEEVVRAILRSKGRLVVTGIGKSGNIAQKMVATMVSTGQPALFMHAADAIHGDLGTIQKNDVVLCISKSGDSPEIKVLVPLVKSMGNTLIAMVSNEKSFLGKHADMLLHTPVAKEACPNNLAPTVSTTLQLAMGDALAVALMEQRGFSSGDFARVHPGGALGKKLYTRVSDLLGSDAAPQVAPSSSIKQVILEISSKRLGATAVVDKGKLVGVITDGDIRRMLGSKSDLAKTKASDIMGRSPKTIESSALAVEAFHLMEKFNITTLVVLNDSKYKGIVHLHDILKEGIF
jgi:arabinose-5-phosphate isomerase